MLQAKTRMIASRSCKARVNGTGFTGTPPYSASSDGFAVMGKQTTLSEGHPFKRKNRARGDIGGPFFTQKSYVLGLNEPTHIRWVEAQEGPGGPNSKAFANYSGPYWPIKVSANSHSFPNPIFSPDSELDEFGATAIARCKPTNSIGSASTMLGEILKDGLPKLAGATLWKDKTHKARAAGSEFLNVEFGWLPLIHDVRSIAHGVAHADTVLRQYERDAGRQVRRTYGFPVERTVTENVVGPESHGYIALASSPILNSTGIGRVVERVETVTRRWFSGAFTYHLPFRYDSRDRMARSALYAKQVLGVELSPEVLWNLAPWSWAVDWFSNAGDVVSNLSDWATDGLVMKYGYVMEHTVHSRTLSWKMERPNMAFAKPSPTPVTFVTETKVRKAGNPFGFGISWDGLSPIQLAIAAALGISRR